MTAEEIIKEHITNNEENKKDVEDYRVEEEDDY